MNIITILAVICIVLVLKLKDALANGRRERDLTMERRDQRRNNSRADSVESLRARERGNGTAPRGGRGREDAYASGARRLDRGEDPRDPRASRPAARPVRPSGDDGYGVRPAARPAAPARKQPAKNFADDDFDYDFLKLDDKDE